MLKGVFGQLKRWESTRMQKKCWTRNATLSKCINILIMLNNRQIYMYQMYAKIEKYT